jgi:hypothetical protein
MKEVNDRDLVKLYEYATRDGFLYAHLFPGSGYGQFLKNLLQQVCDRKITPQQACNLIDRFTPSISLPNNTIDGDVH